MTPEAIASRIVNLISLPRAYHRITEMLADERYGAADIAKVVSHEPALTARLLRMVNSAYYNLPTRVETVPMAINVLGTRALQELVLATSVASAFNRIDTRLVDVADFWHHSIYCGIMARLLSKRLKLAASEQAFIGGLLHDIGKLALYHEAPEKAEEALARFAGSGRPLFQAEEEILGFNHADIGEALLRAWELPEVYREVVGCHHHPNRSRDYHDETCLVHAANALSKKVEPGHKVPTDEGDVPILDPSAAERVPLTAELIEELRIDADVQAIEVYGTLFGGTGLKD
jgi:putative nucleotidyltransferase with HDIG domain